jgi:hypothetical protein
MKKKSLKPIPFLKEQQELAAMFEPEKVAYLFQSTASRHTSKITKTNPAKLEKTMENNRPHLIRSRNCILETDSSRS